MPRTALLLAIALALGWAGVEARHLRLGPPAGYRLPAAEEAPAAVEAGFAALQEARRGGRREEALLGLREQAARGRHPGFASFLLGEMAFEEKAYTAAVGHYRRAVEAEPRVGDHDAPFRSGRIIASRLGFLRQGPWAQSPPPEIRDLYYLQRRLAGGCE